MAKSRTTFDKIRLFLFKNAGALIVISASAIIVLVLITVLLVNSRKTVSNPPVTPVVKTEVQFTPEELSTKIKLILFDNNVPKDEVIESQIEAAEKFLHYINIITKSDVAEKLKKDLIGTLTGFNFIQEYSDDYNHLIFKHKTQAYHMEILLEEKQAIKTVESPKIIPEPDKNSFNEQYPYNITPPKAGNGTIALLIDDAGGNLNLAEKLLDLNIPVTLAILPYLRYTKETAILTREKGQAVFLHFPMEPQKYPETDPGEGAVLVNMPEILIHEIIKKNMENIGKIDGANNHMGSAYTENDTKMEQFFVEYKKYSNVFVDSNTSQKTVAFDKCMAAGLKCSVNKKFLDNSNDRAYITGKLYEAVELAVKNGEPIIAIGHLRADTVAVLAETVPLLKKLGYKFTLVTKVVK